MFWSDNIQFIPVLVVGRIPKMIWGTLKILNLKTPSPLSKVEFRWMSLLKHVSKIHLETPSPPPEGDSGGQKLKFKLFCIHFPPITWLHRMKFLSRLPYYLASESIKGGQEIRPPMQAKFLMNKLYHFGLRNRPKEYFEIRNGQYSRAIYWTKIYCESVLLNPMSNPALESSEVPWQVTHLRRQEQITEPNVNPALESSESLAGDSSEEARTNYWT